MAARLRPITCPRWKAPLAAAIAVLPLMGCSSSYIFRTFNVDGGESLSVDARQRMVLVTHKGGKTRDRMVVCTEPSPDAFTAQAASGQASGNVNVATPTAAGGQSQQSAAGSGSFASSEAAASLAMRTQTVQLLRDSMFRACEAYMNGAIDQHQYNVVLLNIDRLMVTLMGVDAIGGTATVPAVAIGAGADGKGGTAIGEAGTRTGARDVQSEALANIVLSANGHSSLPALCISLLASGELRLDNPGQQALLARCDFLLAGTVNNLVNRPSGPAPQYKVSQHAAGPASVPRTTTPAPAKAAAVPAAAKSAPAPAPAKSAPTPAPVPTPVPAPAASPPASSPPAPAPADPAASKQGAIGKRVAGWAASVDRSTGGSWSATVSDTTPPTRPRHPFAAPQAAGHGWDARTGGYRAID